VVGSRAGVELGGGAGTGGGTGDTTTGIGAVVAVGSVLVAPPAELPSTGAASPLEVAPALGSVVVSAG
jgi:hypothetical protein